MSDLFHKIVELCELDPFPYTREQFEAIYDVVASVRPVDALVRRSDDEADYNPDADYWIYGDDDLMLNVSLLAGAHIFVMKLPRESRTLLEEAQDYEDEAKRIDLVIRNLRSQKTRTRLDYALENGQSVATENTIRELNATAELLRKDARYLQGRAALRPKGKRSPVYHYLPRYLFLWECSGRKVSRTNGTAEFLEAVSSPIWGKTIKPNSMDNYLRNLANGKIQPGYVLPDGV